MITLNFDAQTFHYALRTEEFYGSFWVPTVFMIIYSVFVLYIVGKLFQTMFSADPKKYELVKIFLLLILQTIGTLLFILNSIYFFSGELTSKSHQFYTLVFLISGFVCVLLMVTSKGYRTGKIKYPCHKNSAYFGEQIKKLEESLADRRVEDIEYADLPKAVVTKRLSKVRIGENFYKIADEHDLLKLCSMVTGVTRIHPREYSDKRIDVMSNKTSEVRLKIHEEPTEKSEKKKVTEQNRENLPQPMPMTKMRVLKKESCPTTSGDENKALPVRLSDKLKNKFFSRKVPVEEPQVAQEPERTLLEKITSNKMIPLQAKSSLEAVNSNKSIEKDKADGLCSVCCDSPATIINIPCGHGGTCFQCASELIFTNGLCYLCKMVDLCYVADKGTAGNRPKPIDWEVPCR